MDFVWFIQCSKDVKHQSLICLCIQQSNLCCFWNTSQPNPLKKVTNNIRNRISFSFFQYYFIADKSPMKLFSTLAPSLSRTLTFPEIHEKGTLITIIQPAYYIYGYGTLNFREYTGDVQQSCHFNRERIKRGPLPGPWDSLLPPVHGPLLWIQSKDSYYCYAG